MSYLTVYHAQIRPPDATTLVARGDDYAVHLTAGPFQVTYSTALPEPAGPGNTLLLGQGSRDFPKGSYIVVESPALPSGALAPGQGWRAALGRFARVVAALELDFPGVVGELLYEGTALAPGNSFFLSPPEGHRFERRASYEPSSVSQALQARLDLLDTLPTEDLDRFTLASRWFRRANDSNNSVDQILFYYTVLEVYPAVGSTDIPGAVSKYLAGQLGLSMPPSEVKERLKLGRICGFRGDIIHNGKASAEASELSLIIDYVKRLQAITRTCLRLLARLPPGTDLEPFLLEPSQVNQRAQTCKQT